MSVTIDVLYRGELRCLATHEPSGNTLSTDAPVDNGGRGSTFSPTDLVATALGGCLLTIMGLWAQRENVDLQGARVRVVKEMTAQPMRRIGRLVAEVVLPATSPVLGSDQRARLEAAALRCPVRQSLHPDIAVEVTFSYPDESGAR